MKNVLFFILVLTTSVSFGQAKKVVKKSPAGAKPLATKYGALAIDRDNGYYFGWSYDYLTLAAAEQKAVAECTKKGGDCTVVLSYSGTGCAAYRTINGKVGTAFGWGIAATKEEADAIATEECLKRSGGKTPTNFVWSCNWANTAALKEIYNASGEIEAPVTVGSQTWTNRNLNVSTFSNGDPIPEASTPAEWQVFCKTHKPAYIYLNFDPKNGKKYGKLYNFYAVIDPRGLAPEGWHVPTQREYEKLITFLGGEYEAGKKIRATTGWDIPDKQYGSYAGNGTNSSGLNFLPGGRAWTNEYEKQPTSKIIFNEYYSDGQWWTSSRDTDYYTTGENNDIRTSNGMSMGFSSYKKNLTGVGSESPTRGFSVRLIKN